MITERDTCRADGSIDWRIVRKIARDRALAARDIDILVADGERHGLRGPLKTPGTISQDTVREWRADAASRVDLEGLTLTPFRNLYRDELRRTWGAARAVQTVVLAEAKRNRMQAEGASFASLRLMDMLIGSARGSKSANVERVS